MNKERTSLVEVGVDSSGGGGVVWICEERKEGRDPRKADTQTVRFGETSKSLEAKEAIWRRRDCALGSGGRRESSADEVVVAERLVELGCCCCCGGGWGWGWEEGYFGGVGFCREGELGFVKPSLAGDCTI